MNVQELSRKYDIPVGVIEEEFIPIAIEESEAMGKEQDNFYVLGIVEALCKDYLKESFEPPYKSIFKDKDRYKPIFGSVEPYKPFSDDEELDEEIDVSGVQSTDFDPNMIPEYPVTGETPNEITQKKKKYDTVR